MNTVKEFLSLALFLALLGITMPFQVFIAGQEVVAKATLDQKRLEEFVPKNRAQHSNYLDTLMNLSRKVFRCRELEANT